MKARYTICTITLSDAEWLPKIDTVKHMGITHNEIYLRGLEEYLKEKEN